MSNKFEDDIEPIAHTPPSATSLAKRPRTEDSISNSTDTSNDPLSRLSPEPDEDLDLAAGKHPVWLVKIPKFLLQAWSAIRTDDLRLGTVRVYDPDHKGHQRMELLLPDPPAPAVPTEPRKPRNPRWDTIPRAYDLKLTADSASTLKRNIYAFREKVQDVDGAPGSSLSLVKKPDDTESDSNDEQDDQGGRTKKRAKKRRITALCGSVTNEAALQPQIRSSSSSSASTSMDVKTGLSGFGSAAPISDSYRELLRKRRQEASTPKRSIKMLDSTDAGRHNMLVAGVGAGLTSSTSTRSRFNAAIATKPKTGPGATSASGEKFARMPKNELLDLLFTLFERWQYWSLKKLRSETQQPESYLRDVLTGIADLHKRGPYVGNWSLKPEYSNARKEQEVKEQQQQQEKNKAKAGVSGGADDDEEDFGENDESDDDDDDDDDGEDFDEV
ncbi:related to TFG2 - TFIIF subunit (transcription initiation factor), 54 kD [Melanopsichium pennsylvanicum]|uniref:Transcription initiation factor IIF subunit beta n=2 Tax=Melanopsichium pennsylvanicum TaxID=63383 RepID=A0AAJ4XRZ6_9BASI|nr:related to TFG2-TFIIF subunit (transcription initiation factor), 54 kD [Melanopsichium pennsylvanicum 4]SNX87228.1 related to TFG2 - TFIIF subunit (transcription initiation factor), 54 kD [Melanopsichium pennsylvanicum]